MKKTGSPAKRSHNLAWFFAMMVVLVALATPPYFLPAWEVVAGCLFLLAVGCVFELCAERRGRR